MLKRYKQYRNHDIKKQKRSGNNLDISLFIKKAVTTQRPVEATIVHSFSDFAIEDRLQYSIAGRGYTIPTPIQDKAIEPILQGRDILGLANTGTGKTGAFLIPLINKVLNNPSERVIIIAPTRELALQIDHEFRALAASLKLYSVICVGGTSLYRQKHELSRPFNFVIGTPGRLKDLINQRLLSINNFSSVVLDEVDRMLDMGFIHDVRTLLHYLPQKRQSLFFSATVSKQISSLIQEFSHDLMTISVKSGETAVNVDQDIVHFRTIEEKLDILHELLIKKGFEKVLIFGRTKWGVHKLSQKLNDRGFKTESIHGNKSQPQRQRALTDFRQNKIKILVATDVAARGLDIDGVTHVINYDVPTTYDDYVHRIGRTGRADKKGMALTFVG